jgi:hypothetical protein
MEKQHRLTKHFLIMAFKISFIIFMISLLLFSCKRADEAQHLSYLKNTTGDTIYFVWQDLEPGLIYPYGNVIFLSGVNYSSTIEYIKETYNKDGDTVMFYNSRDTVKWRAPFRNLPDSIHSFYNENSWEITYGGNKNKYERATFTITEDDFR